MRTAAIAPVFGDHSNCTPTFCCLNQGSPLPASAFAWTRMVRWRYSSSTTSTMRERPMTKKRSKFWICMLT